MSSQSSASSAPPPDGGVKESRLHIRGIREMPAGHDEQLAIIFKEMRRAAGVSKEQMAGRLATSVETIAELESGAVLALPEWSELKRIVTAYTAQLGLDARPVLRRLKAQIVEEEPLVTSPAATAGPPPPPPPAPPAPANAPLHGALPMPPAAAAAAQARTAPPQPPAQSPPPQSPRAAPAARANSQAAPARPQARAPAREAENGKRGAGRRLAQSVRPIVNWAILLGFVAALGAGVWYAATRPRAVWSALDSLPAPVPRLMRSAWALVRPLEDTGPRPQVSDPDRRKSDKLR